MSTSHTVCPYHLVPGDPGSCAEVRFKDDSQPILPHCEIPNDLALALNIAFHRGVDEGIVRIQALLSKRLS